MANHCYTTYKITGTHEAVKNLWDTLESMNVNSEEVWLDELAERYGIDYRERQISVRGHINYAELESDENADVYLLTLHTCTAWVGCHDLFYVINETLGDALSISYREIEPGCLVFRVHDEGDFFPEKCYVLSSGEEPFENLSDGIYDTVEDVIQEWCSKMGVERGDKSEDEMMDFINKYEYDDPYTYFGIIKFTFE